MKIVPIILSGGSGTRLWPLSRKQYPKQFISLLGENTLFQEAILRLDGLNELAEPVIVCNHEHRFLVAEQLKQIKVENSTILLEPVGKNTAAAIAVAAYHVLEKYSDAILLVLSSDHIIQNIPAFFNSIELAIKQAKKSKLVIFGINPINPHTGYGYINFESSNDKDVFFVKKFVEKPSKSKAISFIQNGNYLWNSGMFMFSAKTLIEELEVHEDNVAKFSKKSIENSVKDFDFIRLDEDLFRKNPSISIDYALLEKSNNVMVLKLDAGWNDIGSWSALFKTSTKNKDNNAIYGDVQTYETINSYIYSSNRMIATIGINDLVIVDTPDAILVSSKEHDQKVKQIVELLDKKGRNEQLHHRKVYRPWGWYDSIESGEHFQVKRLHVNPGAKLSVQMHHKRDEHWVVVKGVAKVLKGDREFSLIEGESVYIPKITKHSLENCENMPLEIIEVQSGTYLGEDDIIRFQDLYGRAEK
jgi:mannose-1-phosphate guanylyltransferase/mannose-6-phosphate isomerase